MTATGAIQTSYGYTPYGKTTASGTASDNAYQFTGRQNDGNGLYNYRARYYNPVWARFISEDPIGFNGGSNLYSYAGGSPANYTDPLGLFFGDDDFAVAGVGGAIGLAIRGFADILSGQFSGFRSYAGAFFGGVVSAEGAYLQIEFGTNPFAAYVSSGAAGGVINNIISGNGLIEFTPNMLTGVLFSYSGPFSRTSPAGLAAAFIVNVLSNMMPKACPGQ